MPATRKGKPRKKPGPKTGTVQEGSAAHDLLKFAALGVLIIGTAGALAAAPGLAYGAKLFLPETEREKEKRRQKRLHQAMQRLKERGLVRLFSSAEGTRVEVTEAGRESLRQTLYDRVRPEYGKTWDKQWRIVTYDIPEERKDARDALRRLLEGIGFYQMQQSIYVAPYPCKEEITALTEFYRVKSYVSYIEAQSLGDQEERILQHFREIQGAKL